MDSVAGLRGAEPEGAQSSHGKAMHVTTIPRGTERNDDAGRGAVGRILSRLSSDVGPERYARYFERQTRVDFDGGRLDVTVPSGFVADLIGRRFGDSLRRAASAEIAGEPRVEVAIRVDRGAFGATPGAPKARPTRAAARSAPASRHRLDDFVVGECNRMAFDAAQRIGEPDCPRTLSPLFIYGACGMGKTHLLQGISGMWRERDARARVRYTTAESFMNEYVAAVRSGRLDSFRAGVRALHLLCIDDVQFLANKSGTQNELLHTFDAINLDGARVVLASDGHPRQIRQMSAALVSRFMSGMVVRLDPPDAALRGRIVRRLAERRGLKIDEAGAACIAASFGDGPAGSVRDLEGALTRVEALTRLLPEFAGADGREIGLVLVRKALGIGEPDMADGSRRPRRPIRIHQIIEEVCRTLRIETGELMGRGRHRRVVLGRSLVAHLCREMTTHSYPEIARAMGRPSHSTIVTARSRMVEQIAAGKPSGLGAEVGAELAGLSLKDLAEHLKHSVIRAAGDGR